MPLKNSPYCIDVKNLYFSYGQQSILEDINFKVRQGDYLGIIGPNGGGKTTLINLLLGLLAPQKGEIRILNEPTTDRYHRLEIGYVPQDVVFAHDFFPATVEEIIKSGRTSHIGLFQRFSKQDNAIVKEAMEVVGVTDLRDRLISDLSGGQRQRIFIARALVRKPKILILDEPTVGVDVGTSNQFYDFLKKINLEYNITIILISHDIDIVAEQVQYVLCLNHKMICHSKAKDLIHGNLLKKLYGEHFKWVVHGEINDAINSH